MPYKCKSPDDVLKIVTDDNIEMVDLRFTDLPGLWQHFSVPPGALDLDSFTAASASTALRSAAFRKFRKATCWSFQIRRRLSSTRSQKRRPWS